MAKLMAKRYERGWMVPTSHLLSTQCAGASDDDRTLTAATLDRPLHQSPVITIRSDRFRLGTKRRAGLVDQTNANPATTSN